jgi:hypothetical protein
MVDTVQFDLGGKIFKISRALIDEHPDTMLAKMISEAWENENDKDKPLFIDRDGDLFAHVLNYLRYGSIDLPPSTPKTMFQRELDYYGIATEDGTIQPNSFHECVKANDAKFEEHKLAKEMLALAAKCQIKQLENAGQELVAFDIYKEERKLYYSYFKGREMLEKYLDEFFGLTVTQSGTLLSVSIKK